MTPERICKMCKLPLEHHDETQLERCVHELNLKERGATSNLRKMGARQLQEARLAK